MIDSNNKFKNFPTITFSMRYISSDKDLYGKIKGETLKIEEILKKIKEKRGMDKLIDEVDDSQYFIEEVLKKIKEKEGIDTPIDEVDKLKYFYKYIVGDILIKISTNAPQAAGKYVRLIEKLQELDICKSSLIKDWEALYQCMGEYYFKIGIIMGTRRYIELHGEFLSKPGELENFINGLETLVDGKVIKGLYKLYQEVKELNSKYLLDVNKYNHSVSRGDIIIMSYELASKFVADLIFSYLLGYISLETAI